MLGQPSPSQPLRPFAVIVMLLTFLVTQSTPNVALAATSATFQSTARLLGPEVRGQAQFEQQRRAGRLFRQLRLDIDAPPMRTIPIIVNGTLLTTMLTNPAGRARLVVTNPEFFNNERDGVPMPVGFPTLRTGDVIVAGSSIGVMFDRRGGAGIEPPDDVQRVVLRGAFNGTQASPMEGTVEFRMRLVNGRSLERSLLVNVRNAPPNQDVDISFNHDVLATGTADALGNAEIAMRSASFIVPPSVEFPLLGTSPSFQDGDIVRVGGTRVTLARGIAGTGTP